MGWSSLRTCLAACITGLALVLAVGPQASAQTIRKSITQFSPPELMSLRRGVAVMMARNAAPRGTGDFRRSWQFWANMHAHFGASCRGPVTGSGMAGVTAWNASSASEIATWCKCEHGTDSFLTWHRMYVYYFERVLRQAAGDPKLTLPFWDYVADPKLPEAFRAATYVDAQGKTVPNPLRIAGRRPTLNDGGAGIAAGAASAANALSATDYVTFRTRLEATPHGAVHCAIATGGCPTGIMGAVPSAALDPAFYLHHANIDRIYECWLKVDEADRLPADPAILDKSYSFVDANGGVVSRKVRDMLTTAQLGYGYATGADCPAPAPAAPAPSVVAARMEASMADATELRRGVTTLPLRVETEDGVAGAEASGVPDAAAGPPARSALVVIEGLTAAQTPGVLYNVYLANAQGRREQVGVIDFFGFDAGGAASGGHAHETGGRRFEFDATQAYRRLGLRPGMEPAIVFEPTTGLTDSTVAAAIAAIPADAGVRYGRAWLQLGP